MDDSSNKAAVSEAFSHVGNGRRPTEDELNAVQQALKFYANVENWKWVAKPTDTNHILDCGSEVQRDFGEIARNALKSLEG